MMKPIVFFFAMSFVFGCRGMFSPHPHSRESGSEEKQGQPRSSIISAEDLVPGEDTTRYVELVSKEEKIRAMPQVRCNQSALGQAAGAWNLAMTCQLFVGNRPMTIDTDESTVQFLYKHPLPEASPTMVESDGPSPIAQLRFANADLMRVLFYGDTGRYAAQITQDGRTFEIKSERATVTGETCEQPVAGLINFREGNGYTRALTSGIIINGNGIEGGSNRYLVGELVQTSQSGTRFVVIGNGRVIHNGSNGRAIVANFGSFSSANPVQALYAGPYSVVNASAQVMRFRTDLAFCDDRL